MSEALDTQADIRIESRPLDDLPDLARQWQALEVDAKASFFQSWGWIGTWLAEVASDLNPLVLRVYADQTIIGLGILVPAELHRHHVINALTLFLNEYPLDGRNMVLEYNGLLVRCGHEVIVYRAAVQHLLAHYPARDEFHFGALAGADAYEPLQVAVADTARLLTNEVSSAWQVDLAGLPPGLEGCLAHLSKNRRSQVRRAVQLYQQDSPLILDEAADAGQAQAFLDGLKVLHTQRRQARGQRGAFANPRWEAFHRALIRDRFASGEIQLLCVRNASHVIGYLYNFLWRGRVYVQQTGFAMSADKRLQPGYVVHILAMQHNREQGMDVYDLMHGNELYKSILCNRSEPLYWVVLQRGRTRFLLERLAGAVVRRCRSLLR